MRNTIVAIYVIALILCLLSRASCLVLLEARKLDSNAKYYAGKPASLMCIFSDGNDTVNINIGWTKDGRMITTSMPAQEGKSIYMIANLSEADEGEYKCLAMSNSKSKSGVIQVSLEREKPRFESMDKKFYLQQSYSFEIRCIAFGYPKPSVRIKTNKNTYLNQDLLKIQSFNKKKDEGEYACQAKNALGWADDFSFKIEEVNKTKWLDTRQPKFHLGLTDETYQWELMFVSREKPNVQWYKDGDLYQTNSSRVFQKGSKYTAMLPFKRLTFSDAGIYRAAVGNQLTSSTLVNEIDLKVEGQPVVTIIEGKAKTVTLGTRFVIKCEIEAKPGADACWKKNNTVIEKKRAGQSRSRILELVIAKVEPTSAGIYSCFANNSRGSNIVSITLNLQDIEPGPSPQTSTTMIVSLVIGSIILVIVLSVMLYYYWQHQKNQKNINLKFFVALEEQENLTSLEEMEKSNTISRQRTQKHPSMKGEAHQPIMYFNEDEDSSTVFLQGNGDDRRRSTKQIVLDGIRGLSLKRKGQTSIKRPSLAPVPENIYQRPKPVVDGVGEAIEFKNLQFDMIIGEGELGDIAKGQVITKNGNEQAVSIKMLKEKHLAKARCDTLHELQMMRKIPWNPNIIKLIGWCIVHDNVYIVEEFAPLGNLLNILRANRLFRMRQSSTNGANSSGTSYENATIYNDRVF